MLQGIFLFILGVLVGFSCLALIASAKQRDLWAAVKQAAYADNNTLCKELVEGAK